MNQFQERFRTEWKPKAGKQILGKFIAFLFIGVSLVVLASAGPVAAVSVFIAGFLGSTMLGRRFGI